MVVLFAHLSVIYIKVVVGHETIYLWTGRFCLIVQVVIYLTMTERGIVYFLLNYSELLNLSCY